MLADQTPLPSLSAAMRDGSQAEHQQAEGSTFMAALLDGQVNEQGYADYLRCLRTAYAAMERLVREHRDHPAVAAVHDPALERLGALDADLAHWAPGEPHPTGSPAAAAYAGRLAEAAAEWPALLVAHHYTRYLGDLSGGQAIGRILDRTFGLGGAGLAFYDFPGIPKPKPYKDAYRSRLDDLGLTAPERHRVVAEVRTAFRLNQALFHELGQRLPAYARA